MTQPRWRENCFFKEDMASKSSRAGTLLGRIAERRKAIQASLGEFVGAFRSVMKSLDAEAEAKARAEKEAPSEPVIEETMEEILAQLGDGHLVIHEVSCQFGKLDYVILSRDHGLFLIETKSHTGRVAIVDSKIRINGTLPEEDFISQSLHISYWLVEELRSLTGADVEATPLLVFTEAVLEVPRELKDVTITNKKSLLARLRETATPLPAPIWEAREKIAEAFAAAMHR